MINRYLKRTIITTAKIIVIILILIIGLIVFFEDSFIYFPWKTPKGTVYKTAIGIDSEECDFTTADGVKINGLYARAKGAEFTLLWCHGNAGNISDRLDMLEQLVQQVGVDVFIFDYRGYGKSEGKPSEDGLYKDVDATYDFLRKQKNIPANKIVIFGKSLGGAVAINLASRIKGECAGLIVQSSFTSAGDMAYRVIPLFPSYLLMRNKFDSASRVGDIPMPKLFIHSPDDEVVPYKLGKELFELASEPKRFYEVKGAGHNNAYIVGGKQYFDEIKSFLDRITRR